MSSNKTKTPNPQILVSEVSNDTESFYDNDPRLNDMLPIIKSLEFLMRESKKGGNDSIHELIKGAFKMVLIADDLCKKSTSQIKKN